MESRVGAPRRSSPGAGRCSSVHGLLVLLGGYGRGVGGGGGRGGGGAFGFFFADVGRDTDYPAADGASVGPLPAAVKRQLFLCRWSVGQRATGGAEAAAERTSSKCGQGLGQAGPEITAPLRAGWGLITASGKHHSIMYF